MYLIKLGGFLLFLNEALYRQAYKQKGLGPPVRLPVYPAAAPHEIGFLLFLNNETHRLQALALHLVQSSLDIRECAAAFPL